MTNLGNNLSFIYSEAFEAKSSIGIKLIYFLNFFTNLFGGLLHFGLILVTFRNKKFHSACHLMIAANSMAIIITYLFIITPFMIVLLPQASIKLTTCFPIQFIPIFSGFHIYSLMLAIGFDRMLSVFLPKWYISRNEYSYLSLLFAASLLFPIFLTGMAFKNVLSQPNNEIICTLGEILYGQTLFTVLCCLFCIIGSATFYVLVWIRIKWETKSSENEDIPSWQSTMFRSLCIILCLQICGWIFGQSIFVIVYINPDLFPSLIRWQLNSLVLCFLSISAAFEVIVLYTTSSEYKMAFQKQFPWLRKICPVKKEIILMTKVKSRASLITPIPIEKPLSPG